MSGVHDERALVQIHRLARAGRVVVSRHAYERMDERGAEETDVINALVTSTAAIWQPARLTWRVTGGVDIEGDVLTVVVDITADVVVVTLF